MPYSPDDYQIDDWVTIHDDVETDGASPFDDDEPPFVRRMRRDSTAPRPGIPLRILAVHLPHVYLAVLDADGEEVGPAIIDVRRHRLARVGVEIPEAIIAFARKKRDAAAARDEEKSRRKAKARASADVARSRASDDDENSAPSSNDEDDRESPNDADVTTRSRTTPRDDDPTPDDA
ncbi:MAG: hypothetical protein RLZZ461_2076 [Planctomycetota bacterium]|jgi:hypothetical protein